MTRRNGTPPTELVIRHAHVLDPGNGLDGVADVRLREGRVSEIGEGLRGVRELDADGLHLFPGFVDVHAHWRTPGREDEESVESGSAAAAAGGFTGVVMMPNTDPVVDTPAEAVPSPSSETQNAPASFSRRISVSRSPFSPACRAAET